MKKQDEGKKRREAIALASLKRKQTRYPDSYGVLPAHKSGDVYLRGVTKISEREEVHLFTVTIRPSKYESFKSVTVACLISASRGSSY
jgi:hypothetical protein